MQFAQRLQPLKSNVFADMDTAKAKALAAGVPIVDLSLGSSDLPAEAHVIEAIAQSLKDPLTHGSTQETLPCCSIRVIPPMPEEFT